MVGLGLGRSRTRRVLVRSVGVALVLGVVGVVGPGGLSGLGSGAALAAESGGPRDPARVREAVREVLSDPRYQTRRPTGELAPERPKLPPRRPREFKEPPRFEPSSASGVSEAILWVLGGTFAAAVLLILGRELARFARRRGRRRRGGGEGSELGDLIVDAARRNLPASLERARGLAQAGRYEEAVHVLLTAAMGYLHARAGFSLEPSYTSREVLGLAPIEGELMHALSELVGVVEVSLFGGSPVGPEGYARCERSFVTLHEAIGRSDDAT